MITSLIVGNQIHWSPPSITGGGGGGLLQEYDIFIHVLTGKNILPARLNISIWLSAYFHNCMDPMFWILCLKYQTILRYVAHGCWRCYYNIIEALIFEHTCFDTNQLGVRRMLNKIPGEWHTVVFWAGCPPLRQTRVRQQCPHIKTFLNENSTILLIM